MVNVEKHRLPLYALIINVYNPASRLGGGQDQLLIRWSRVRISADPPMFFRKHGALAQLVEQRTLNP